MVSYRPNKKNTKVIPMCFALQRACDAHLQSVGVQSSEYNLGPVRAMDPTAQVSINGKRYTLTVYTINI